MNSTNEGLYYGVSLIVIPQGADQPFVAKRVFELGAASKLRESFQLAGGECMVTDEIVKFKNLRASIK